MTEFTKFYEKKTAELKEMHDAWVESNRKLNSLHLALRQIKSEGDTSITPAEEVLKSEYTKEHSRNEKACTKMYALKSFVRDMEREAREYGVEWNRATEIFGY